MYQIDKTNYMMLEFTSACNARCPDCARTKNFINKNITPEGSLHLTKQNMNNLFGVKWNNLRKINIDGNYGDSMYHPHALELLEIIMRTQDASKIKLYIDTNGGYKTPEFWKALADIMKYFNPTSCVTFGIDGVDNETHQRYRVRVNLDKVFENAQAFMSQGGLAEWKWIGFDWNDHQLDKAKQMAKEMGFDAFIYKNTRVRNKVIEQAITNATKLDDNTKSNISKQIVKETNKEVASTKDFKNDCTIQCKFRRESNYGFQVEHYGRVFQCCHLPGYYNYQLPGSKLAMEYEYYTNKYNSNWNSLNTNNILDILRHEYFSNDLEESWNNRTDSIVNPRIMRCVTKCGSYEKTA